MASSPSHPHYIHNNGEPAGTAHPTVFSHENEYPESIVPNYQTSKVVKIAEETSIGDTLGDGPFDFNLDFSQIDDYASGSPLDGEESDGSNHINLLHLSATTSNLPPPPLEASVISSQVVFPDTSNVQESSFGEPQPFLSDSEPTPALQQPESLGSYDLPPDHEASASTQSDSHLESHEAAIKQYLEMNPPEPSQLQDGAVPAIPLPAPPSTAVASAVEFSPVVKSEAQVAIVALAVASAIPLPALSSPLPSSSFSSPPPSTSPDMAYDRRQSLRCYRVCDTGPLTFGRAKFLFSCLQQNQVAIEPANRLDPHSGGIYLLVGNGKIKDSLKYNRSKDYSGNRDGISAYQITTKDKRIQKRMFKLKYEGANNVKETYTLLEYVERTIHS